MEAGRNPRATALDVIGRMNRVTKRREGGLLGLTTNQMRFVSNARAELLSGDPAQMAAYLERKRRDKRFDPAVRKAIREGKPVPAAVADKITGRYSDRLLALRGEMIARTESLTAFSNAQWEGVRQMIESGRVRADQVTKVWRATRDGRTRDSHAALGGTEAQMNEAFMSPLTGARMMHPHDASLGAPASEIIGCRCFCQYSIDFIGGLV